MAGKRRKGLRRARFWRRREILMVCGLAGLCLLYAAAVLRLEADDGGRKAGSGTYESLAPDLSEEAALAHIDENFTADESFHSNLPIVVMKLDTPVTEYKSFKDNKEIIYDDLEPYSDGEIAIYSSPQGSENDLNDTPVYTGRMKIKKRGHTSFSYDKPQYRIRMVTEEGLENQTSILGMGEGDEWILNGSMADKSMLRNYLALRIASEIGGNSMAPDCRYCEVLLETNDGYEYQGVYLLMETIGRGKDRVDIDRSKESKTYTSYIVRRDRYTGFDVMLDTYGRLSGLSEEWIGVKYPSAAKLTDRQKQFIEQDFSQLEEVLYSEEESVLKTYDRYIDLDSFVDYFLINEFFGNYDAGNHSTYMYKNSGGKLMIGPVWDFDQAMNNYYAQEMETDTLAFQTKPLFAQLCTDRRFIDCLKERYSVLRRGILSEKHVLGVITETVAYLKNAQQREWYRWAADYMDGSFSNIHNYYLQDYTKDGTVISRFNDVYEQELYTIRTYLHRHGNAIQTELTKLYDLTQFNSSLGNEKELMLLAVLVLFLLPSVLINRKG